MKRALIALPLALVVLAACHTDPFSTKPEVRIDPDKIERPAEDPEEDTETE